MRRRSLARMETGSHRRRLHMGARQWGGSCWVTLARHETHALVAARCVLNVTHFRVRLRLFVGDAGAPTVELSLGFLPSPLSLLLDLLASALVVSVAILPPSFSHRSSIFFFRRFLAIGSGIVLSSLSFHSLHITL